MYQDDVSECSSDEVPEQTRITVMVSVFPPIPMNADLLCSLIDQLSTSAATGVQEMLQTMGLDSSIHVTGRVEDTVWSDAREIQL